MRLSFPSKLGPALLWFASDLLVGFDPKTRELPSSRFAASWRNKMKPKRLHDALDKAVLNAYGLKAKATDIGILEMLFTEFAFITNGLLAVEPVKRKHALPRT